MIGCDCAVCRSTNPRNHRYRCAVMIQAPAGNVLIDTPPELRLQLLREKVGVVHAVLYTHYHADHLFGLDDVRPMIRYLSGPLPLYCTQEMEEKVRNVFAYAFPSPHEAESAGFIPRLCFERIGDGPFLAGGQEVIPIPLMHARMKVLGFRIGNVAYCTDVNFIPESSYRLLQNLDVLILDALRLKPHSAHFSLREALEVIDRIKPRRAYLTHLAHDIDHDLVSKQLPANVELAYDGLRLDF